MVKLEDVKIYKNKKNEYTLVSCENGESFEEISHKEIRHWAQLYIFPSQKFVDTFLNSMPISSDVGWYYSISKTQSDAILLLLVNKDAEGGIHSYEDLRSFKATRWPSPS